MTSNLIGVTNVPNPAHNLELNASDLSSIVFQRLHLAGVFFLEGA